MTEEGGSRVFPSDPDARRVQRRSRGSLASHRPTDSKASASGPHPPFPEPSLGGVCWARPPAMASPAGPRPLPALGEVAAAFRLARLWEGERFSECSFVTQAPGRLGPGGRRKGSRAVKDAVGTPARRPSPDRPRPAVRSGGTGPCSVGSLPESQGRRPVAVESERPAFRVPGCPAAALVPSGPQWSRRASDVSSLTPVIRQLRAHSWRCSLRS